jgi:hypothetical protein
VAVSECECGSVRATDARSVTARREAFFPPRVTIRRSPLVRYRILFLPSRVSSQSHLKGDNSSPTSINRKIPLIRITQHEPSLHVLSSGQFTKTHILSLGRLNRYWLHLGPPKRAISALISIDFDFLISKLASASPLGRSFRITVPASYLISKSHSDECRVLEAQFPLPVCCRMREGRRMGHRMDKRNRREHGPVPSISLMSTTMREITR